MPVSVPEFLTHYYEGSKAPFASLSDLDDVSLEIELSALAALKMPLYRFKTREKADRYMQLRRDTESRVRLMFTQKGGTPKLMNPRYMVLGTSKWFGDWYLEKREIRVPLADFDAALISFTYPDSLISMILADSPQWEAYRRPYHGKVFTKAELPGVIEEFGMPNEDDPVAIKTADRVVEAQIWDLEPLKHYLPINSPPNPSADSAPRDRIKPTIGRA